MEEDPVYADVASGLAARLVRYGLDRDSPAFTQKLGQA
jgi:hypothetical protein